MEKVIKAISEFTGIKEDVLKTAIEKDEIKEIKFDGTSSSDPNGYELSYSWNMGNGELIEKDIFTYKYMYPGTYLVTLMVYNGRNYAWNTISVTIQNQEITSP